MRYYLFQKFFEKMVKIKETSFLSTSGMILIFGNCRCMKIIYHQLDSSKNGFELVENSKYIPLLLLLPQHPF